jgi:adrenodoxin-NADP+ reductase
MIVCVRTEHIAPKINLFWARAGPLDVAFTIKELRELTKLDGCTPSIDPAVMRFTDEEAAHVAADRRKKRLTTLMGTIADDTAARIGDDHTMCTWSKHPGVNVVFHRSPVAFEPSQSNPSAVGAVRFEINAPEGPIDNRVARGTGTFETIECGAVFRSIG